MTYTKSRTEYFLSRTLPPQNGCDLQYAQRSGEPEVDSIDAHNPLAVRLRPAQFPPDAEAV
jgi:hypothetical protein